MALHYTYMQAMSLGFSGVECSQTGIGNVFENIAWSGGTAMPTKAEVDAWITEKYKTEMWELIKAERDRRKLDGGYKIGTDWFHSDVSSRIQQMGLVIMGAGIPANLYWKTMGSSFVLMTQTLAGQIFQAAAASDMTIFTIAEQKKAAMLASANPETYDYMSGWPLMYGE